MESFSLNYLLNDLKKLDKAELFEKIKALYYDNEKLAYRICVLEEEIALYKTKSDKKHVKEDKITNYEGYKSEAVMAEKIVFILKRNKKSMSTSEIIEVLLKLEPKLNDRYKDKVKVISNFIYNTLRCGFIVRDKKSFNGGYKYALNKNNT